MERDADDDLLSAVVPRLGDLLMQIHEAERIAEILLRSRGLAGPKLSAAMPARPEPLRRNGTSPGDDFLLQVEQAAFDLTEKLKLLA